MSEKFFFKLEDMHDTAETWTAPFWGPHLGEKEQEGMVATAWATLTLLSP